MNNTEKLIIAFAVFIIGAGIFVGIGQWAKTIDLATIPEFAQKFIITIQNFFSLGPVAFILLYLRNLLGYARNWFLKHKTETVTFEMDRYYNTILYYIGVFLPVVAVFPEPYNWIGGVLVTFVDIFTAEYKKIQPVAPVAPTT
jgi:hypothetical protein